MKKIISLLLCSVVALSMSAQTYTIVSRNNQDTIKLFSNSVGKAIKNLIPGAKEDEAHNFLIKKVQGGKESLLFVEFSQDEKKILTSYETDLETPGKWQTKIYTLYDIYSQLKRENAIFLSGEIIGIHVDMYQRPANFQDIIVLDGVEFPSPVKFTVLDGVKNQVDQPKQDDEQRQILKELAAKDENKAYIAYLIKVELLDLRYKEEVEGTYNMNEVMQLVESTSDKDLLKMSKTHSEQLNKYRK